MTVLQRRALFEAVRERREEPFKSVRFKCGKVRTHREAQSALSLSRAPVCAFGQAERGFGAVATALALHGSTCQSLAEGRSTIFSLCSGECEAESDACEQLVVVWSPL